ncbi:unnamed protein product [Closterium sp. Naga37s-1]|nr:unnamed protein product [Closterium sp. Naga37s-1]
MPRALQRQSAFPPPPLRLAASPPLHSSATPPCSLSALRPRAMSFPELLARQASICMGAGMGAGVGTGVDAGVGAGGLGEVCWGGHGGGGWGGGERWGGSDNGGEGGSRIQAGGVGMWTHSERGRGGECRAEGEEAGWGGGRGACGEEAEEDDQEQKRESAARSWARKQTHICIHPSPPSLILSSPSSSCTPSLPLPPPCFSAPPSPPPFPPLLATSPHPLALILLPPSQVFHDTPGLTVFHDTPGLTVALPSQPLSASQHQGSLLASSAALHCSVVALVIDPDRQIRRCVQGGGEEDMGRKGQDGRGEGSMEVVDVVALVNDAHRQTRRPDPRVRRMVGVVGAERREGQQRIAVVSKVDLVKVDLVKDKRLLLPLAQELTTFHSIERSDTTIRYACVPPASAMLFQYEPSLALSLPPTHAWSIPILLPHTHQAVQAPWEEDPRLCTDQSPEQRAMQIVRELLLHHVHQVR